MSRKNRIVTVDNSVKQRSSPIEYVLSQQKWRTRQDLTTLRLAIESANNIQNYSRKLLHDVFREAARDPAIASNWESRKLKTKSKQFKFCSKPGEDNPEITKIFESKWFTDWMDAVMDADFWGQTLIEFGPWENNTFMPYQVTDGNGKSRLYDPITVVDRDCVKPELGIITASYGDSVGVAFSDKDYKDYLMYVGRVHDFGILFKLVKYFLMKDNCVSNWSEWIEVFGMDKRVGYTRTQDTDRIAFMRAMRDLGNNSYAVFNADDRVEYIGSQRQDAYNVYLEFLKYCDSAISKMIWGQDVVQNNTGQVVGEVGEEVSNMYGEADAKNIVELVNKRLIPFMENLGFNAQGCYMEWITDEKLTQADQADRDLKIHQMGFTIDPEYIKTTYGVDVEATVEPDAEGANDKVKKAYKKSA